MSYLIVRHTVQDFGRWKPVFDEHAAVRRAAGCKGGLLFRDAENPNDVTMVFDWSDIDRAKAFAQSDNLREVMTRAGVAGPPTVQFVEKLEDLGA